MMDILLWTTIHNIMNIPNGAIIDYHYGYLLGTNKFINTMDAI